MLNFYENVCQLQDQLIKTNTYNDELKRRLMITEKKNEMVSVGTQTSVIDKNLPYQEYFV